MLRVWVIALVACGGSSAKPAEPTSPTHSTVEPSACATAYAEYEARWTTARGEELAEVEFDAESIAEVIENEVAVLPKKTELASLRGVYAAVAVFIPDAPWPLALAAAGRAIDHCGEAATRP
jgi:hypothetical protein